MVSRKRDRAEMESSEPPKEMGVLDRLRNMWQFANLMQYIFIFGRAVKIDEDFTIDVGTFTHSSALSRLLLQTCR
jgi:hypothetical protein